jgi:rhodanese-related sulfurtransferase
MSQSRGITSDFKNVCIRSAALIVGFAMAGLAFNTVSPRGVSIFKEPPKPVSPWKHLTLEEGMQIWKERRAIFVDSRDAADFCAGHIAGAMNLPVFDFEKQWETFALNVAPELDLVIYCNGGNCEQSHKLAERLKQAGYSQISILADGYFGWKKREFPTATGE